MNKIIIITTKGCEACSIAINHVDVAIFQSSKDITKEVLNREDSKELIKKYSLKDFPSILYVVDDKVQFKVVGSYPTAVFLRWIDMYFKI